MLRRLVAQPKLRAINGQPRHDRAAGILHAVDLGGSECRLVELNRSRAVPNGQHGRDRADNGSPRARSRGHRLVPPYIDEGTGRAPLTAATPNQTKRSTTRGCVRVNVAMVMPKIMGATFRRKGPNVRGVVSACNAGVGVPYLAPTPPRRAGGNHALDTLTDLRLARLCLRRWQRSTSRAVGRGRGGDQEDRAKLGSGDARR